MGRGTFSIVSESSSEDRFDEVDNLTDAVSIARRLAEQDLDGEPVSIEHNGRVICQFLATSDGVIETVQSSKSIDGSESPLSAL